LASESAVPTEVSLGQEEQAPEENQEAQDQNVLSQLRNLDPNTRNLVERLIKETRAKDQESINRRIGKEVAKTKSLEARLAEMESAPPKEKEVQVPVTLPTADQPLANINDKATLTVEYRKARDVYRMVDDLIMAGPDEMGEYKVEDKTFTKEQLIQIRRNSAKMVDEFIPQRLRFLDAKEQHTALAKKDFPWLNQPESQEYKLAQEQRRSAPWLAALPNSDYLVGVFVEGIKALQEKATPKVAPITPPARKAPSDQTASSQTASGGVRDGGLSIQRERVQGSMQKMSKAGGVNGRDVAAFLLNKELSRT
jgi:hypothetical protein